MMFSCDAAYYIAADAIIFHAVALIAAYAARAQAATRRHAATDFAILR